MKKYLTLKELERMGACYKARCMFERIFGKKTTIREAVRKLHKLDAPTWESWLLAQKRGLTLSMFRRGANIHADEDGALQVAARCGNTEIVKLLLRLGANVYAQGAYALYLAEIYKHTETAEIIRQAMKKPVQET